ncbi:GMC oxidoreductase [Cylindrobasidium torrendii FP15055 ss-10]|uniref:GMC oxidoreductase n=1 Tax=Cylindrobasidium torrendii FP15055 ss-10 TaxID=1314674 RepID=A0A0D7BFM1_9AGAR|nr:GMC oxidoreductase [Cylindrobasidium torrendii FP15055 ss-10]
MALPKFQSLLALVLCATTSSVVAASCPSTSNSEYDYIVVGSGAGGGSTAGYLIDAGFSVLLIDAGHDVDTVNTTVPLYFPNAVEDPDLVFGYKLDEFPEGFKYQRNDVWYPRSGNLGGCTRHNAMINVLAGMGPDVDIVADMFEDDSFSRDAMQDQWKRIERALYDPGDVADHGFDGWLPINDNPSIAELNASNPAFLDDQLIDFLTTVQSSGEPITDFNDLSADNAVGVGAPVFTKTADHRRSSVRDWLVALESSTNRLTFQLDTLVTKVLTCTDDSGNIKAYGVEYAEGVTVPVSPKFTGKQDLDTKTVTAKREIIVAAGAYQSPQLLMLSGIGEAAHLKEHGIDVVVDLPGVGQNLQDHDEIAVIWELKEDLAIFEGCNFKSDPEEDACLKYFLESGKPNLYSFGGLVLATAMKTDRPEVTDTDIVIYWSPVHFQGFVPGFSQEIAQNHNAVTAVHLKARPSSRGYLRLTGGHPQDELYILKNRFQGDAGYQDVVDLREAIKHSREVLKQEPFASHVASEIFPGEGNGTDEEIEDHIYKHIFGHHVCCTNAMGPDSDKLAVLDQDFRVRGVQNLRVVDASSWPIVPAYFPTASHLVLAGRAADAIIADASAA